MQAKLSPSTQLSLGTQKEASQMWPAGPHSTVLAQQQTFSKAAQEIQMLTRVDKHHKEAQPAGKGAGDRMSTLSDGFLVFLSLFSAMLGNGTAIHSRVQARTLHSPLPVPM